MEIGTGWCGKTINLQRIDVLYKTIEKNIYLFIKGQKIFNKVVCIFLEKQGPPERKEMSMKPSDMNARLEDALSRIAVETQEIQELEQQLTDGEDRRRPITGLLFLFLILLVSRFLLSSGLQGRFWPMSSCRRTWKGSSVDFRNISEDFDLRYH